VLIGESVALRREPVLVVMGGGTGPSAVPEQTLDIAAVDDEYGRLETMCHAMGEELNQMSKMFMEKKALCKGLEDEYADLLREEDGMDFQIGPRVPTVLRNSKTRMRDAEQMRKLIELADKKFDRGDSRMKSNSSAYLRASMSRSSLQSGMSQRTLGKEFSRSSVLTTSENGMSASDRLQMLRYETESLEGKGDAEAVFTHVLHHMMDRLKSARGAEGISVLRKEIQNLDAAISKADSIRAKIQGQGSRIAHEVHVKFAEIEKERDEHERQIQQSKITSAKMNEALKRRERRILGRSMGKEERDSLLHNSADSKFKQALLYLNLDVGRRNFLSGVTKLLHDYSTDSLENVYESYEVTLRDNEAMQVEISEKNAEMEKLSRALQHKLRNDFGADTRIIKGRRAVDQMEERVASIYRKLIDTMEKERNMSKILWNGMSAIATLKDKLGCVQLSRDDKAQIAAFHDLHNPVLKKVESSPAAEEIIFEEGGDELFLDDSRSERESVANPASPVAQVSEVSHESQVKLLLHDISIIIDRLQTPGSVLTAARGGLSSPRQPSITRTRSSDTNEGHVTEGEDDLPSSSSPREEVELTPKEPFAPGARNFRNITDIVKKVAVLAPSRSPSVGKRREHFVMQSDEMNGVQNLTAWGPTNPYNVRVFPAIFPHAQNLIAKSESDDDPDMSADQNLESEFLAQSRKAYKKIVHDAHQTRSRSVARLPKI